MKTIGILDIPSPGALGGVFSELISAMSTAFASEGIEVVYSRDALFRDMPVLIFGWYRMFIEGKIPAELPPNAFIFNLAPLIETGPAWFLNYIGYLKKSRVIDYSYKNLEMLNESGTENSRNHLFRFGYAPLTSFKFPRRGNDYVFYGAVNDYRKEKLGKMKTALPSLKILHNIWGFERDLQIATAKAVINIGKYPSNILEVYRIWHSLCLGTPVVTEYGSDRRLATDWNQFVTFSRDLAEITDLPGSLIDPDIFRSTTSFQQSTRDLLNFMQADA